MNQGKNKRHSPVSMTVDCVGASATSGISGGDPSTFFQLWLQIRDCVGLNGFVSPPEEYLSSSPPRSPGIARTKSDA